MCIRQLSIHVQLHSSYIYTYTGYSTFCCVVTLRTTLTQERYKMHMYITLHIYAVRVYYFYDTARYMSLSRVGDSLEHIRAIHLYLICYICNMVNTTVLVGKVPAYLSMQCNMFNIYIDDVTITCSCVVMRSGDVPFQMWPLCSAYT